MQIKRHLRQLFSNHPGLLARLRIVYCALGFGTKTDRDFLFALARQKRDVFFLEIGANDGQRGDPIHYFVKKYSWGGIALEPVPEIFERLQKTYSGNTKVKPICAALSDADGQVNFYRVKPAPEVPAFCSELGSFSREVILSHRTLFPEIDEYLIGQKVEALRFKTLVEREMIEKIDVILIDAEGYDYEILRQIDFDRFCPEIVIYEHIHLNADAIRKSKELLEIRGYSVFDSYNTNYVAVRN